MGVRPSHSTPSLHFSHPHSTCFTSFPLPIPLPLSTILHQPPLLLLPSSRPARSPLRVLHHRRQSAHWPQQNPKRAAMPSQPALLALLLLMLLMSAAAASNDGYQAEGAGSSGPARRRDLVPVSPTAELGSMALGLMNDTARRRLAGSFQLCAPCTCCGGSRGACVLSPCCYSINCNIPNRPFGYCSFTPKSCDCLGCNL